MRNDDNAMEVCFCDVDLSAFKALKRRESIVSMCVLDG